MSVLTFRSCFLSCLLTVASAAFAAHPRTAVESRPVSYKEGSTELEGFVSFPKTPRGLTPVVIVVHDWKGVSDYFRERTQKLAEMGYIGFAADIYGKGVRPSTNEDAGKLAGSYKDNREKMRARIRAAYDEAKHLPGADPGRIVVIGYCFGGTVALELGRSGASLAGIVSFHGGLATPKPEDAKNIRGKVLALHGADDPTVPPAEVAAFEDEMRQAKVDWQLVAYGNAVHAFTNPALRNAPPGSATAYNATADARSWVALKNFLTEVFGERG
jgi:dienelactone hydrolase